MTSLWPSCLGGGRRLLHQHTLPFCALGCALPHLSCGTSRGTGLQGYLTSRRISAQRSFLAGERREKNLGLAALESSCNKHLLECHLPFLPEEVWKTQELPPNTSLVAAASGLEIRLTMSFAHLIPAAVFMTLVFQELVWVWCGKGLCSFLLLLLVW